MSARFREKLGDFSSVVCLKYIITGVEDTLGADGAAVVFTRAGKVRGRQLTNELGLTGQEIAIDNLAGVLNGALGQGGTRLCEVVAARAEGDTITIEVTNTICAAGEEVGSDRKATYTLGAIAGAVEEIYGKMYNGTHTTSVLKGDAVDTFVFEVL